MLRWTIVCAALSAGCATTPHGRAVQGTAVGATLATNGTVGLALGGAYLGIIVSQTPPEAQPILFEAITIPVVVGGLAAVGFVVAGATILSISVDGIDAVPAPRAAPKREPRRVPRKAPSLRPVDDGDDEDDDVDEVPKNPLWGDTTDVPPGTPQASPLPTAPQ